MNSTIEQVKRILRIFKIYHRYSVKGINKFPLDCGVLLVTNHSLATYDGFLLGLEILEKTGRLSRGLGDDLLFQIPVLKNWCSDIGLVPASNDNAKKLLRQKEVLGVAPGGMREALRPSAQRYELKWAKRKGFVKLAISEQAPIVLAACPNADRIFKVYESFFTAFLYKKFRIPVPFFKGYALSAIPRPVKLTHYLSDPILPPKVDANAPISQEVVDEFHQYLIHRMKSLMANVDHHTIV